MEPRSAPGRPRSGTRWLQKYLTEVEEAPRAAQGAQKRGPGSHRRGPRGTKRRQEAAGSDFAPILERCWEPLGFKKPQKVLYCQRFLWFSRFLQGPPKRGPKSSQKSFPGGQNGPQERPRRRQERPKSAQEGPKSRQERPKSAPRAAQEGQKRIKKGRCFDFGPRKASGRLPGAIFD